MLDLVVHTYNPSTRKPRQEDLEARLAYINSQPSPSNIARPASKKHKTNKQKTSTF
jgi:hypothetical protein